MKRESGQSLFELVSVVFVISMGLLALVSLSARAVSNTSQSRDKTIAGRLTQEGIEWIRSERDRMNWATFRDTYTSPAGNRTYCMNVLSATTWTQSSGCSGGQVVQIGGQNTSFVRTGVLTRVGADTINVIVVTNWVDATGNREARVTTSLTSWRGN